jgi:predicted peroxiredoxin
MIGRTLSPLLLIAASLLAATPRAAAGQAGVHPTGAASGAASLLPTPLAQASTGMAQQILVHITYGPEHPTRAALGFAVAKAALDDGHAVSIFLAGDAVQLIREPVLESLSGLGTGNLRELYQAIVAQGGRLYLSGGSSKARGVTEQDLEGKPAEFAGPSQLVRLSLEHDRMFTY